MKFMQFKMSENSLFAHLLRSPWWVSFIVAATVALIARYLLPDRYLAYALSFAIPFVVVGGMAAWRQWQRPSSGRVQATEEAVGNMSWKEFSTLLESAYQREGMVVSRVSGAADFKLTQAGRTTLVSGRRWKAANHGLETLRELDAARRACEAHAAIYIAIGNVSEKAVAFAAANRITLMRGAELAGLLRLPKSKKKHRS